MEGNELGTASRLFFGSIITTTRRAIGLKRPHVLIACMPKSASSFLSDAVAGMKGMRHGSLAWSYGGREQTLDVVQLARIDHRAYVAQQHVRYSSDVGEFIEEFNLTPVVLTRNVFDVVASFRDHIRSLEPGDELMLAPLTPSHANLPDAALEDLIAELIIPWYINFYASWSDVDTLRVTYDQVRSDSADVVRRICERAGIAHNESEIASAVESARAKAKRFNKGVSGRGAALSPAASERIASFARHYPDVDFREIGLS
jgi:hypothetical protein